MLTRKTVLLARVESVYGEEPADMGADDAVLIGNLDIDINPTELDRDVYHDSISAYGVRIGKKTMTCSFDVELKGRGILPDELNPIEQDALLRACGLLNTDTGSGVSYTPRSESMDSITLKFNLDGQQYLMTGCYGNMSWNLVAGNFGVITFNFTGLYNTPTDVAQVDPSYVNQTEPPVLENIDLSVDGYMGCSENLTFDFNNEVSERPCLNAPEGLQGLRITNRNITGSVDPEMVSVATKDFFTIFEESSKIVMSMTIGGTIGNQFDVDFANIQLTNITPGDRNGIRIYNLDFLATGDDDEFSLLAY